MQIREFLLKALNYLKTILLVDLTIGVIVALSFLLLGNLTFLAYSERMFYVAVFIFLIGGVVGVAAMFAGKGFGIPLIIRRPSEARKLLDHFMEYREEVEKRYDTSIQIWLVGLGCIGISALVEMLFTR